MLRTNILPLHPSFFNTVDSSFPNPLHKNGEESTPISAFTHPVLLARASNTGAEAAPIYSK
jgi:hypothetical protein